MPIIVVPAKPLARAKQRLSHALDQDQRKRLSLAMLADVCAAGTAAGRVIVVGSDDETFEVARAAGAETLPDPTPLAGLNPSLEAAIGGIDADEDDGVLVLSSDLPAVRRADIVAMFGHGVRLAPDATGHGTNALWRRPAHAIPLAFGDRSAQAHRRLALERDVAFEIVRTPALALDVDLPEHLIQAWEADIGPHTRQALASFGLPHAVAEFDIVRP